MIPQSLTAKIVVQAMILFVLTARVNMDLLVELVLSVKYLAVGIVMEMPASAPNVTTFWDSM